MKKKVTTPIHTEAIEKSNPAMLQNITETLETNFMPYAMSVIYSRAIPEIDGFKPAHRKLLYTMYNMGLLRSQRRKSADVVGQTMQLNPHGDGAIYETLVRLTRGNNALLHPYIDSKGSFGKHYSRDMAYAASRYTEVRLDSICDEIFRDINKNTVDMVDSYDGKMKEPVLFPTTFPNILVTPNQGIAVGMASSICSFNLKEVCAATIAYMKDENADMLKYISAPDFSTGASFIYNEAEMKNAIETGRASFKLRAKYNYDKKNNCIEIYEIPYSTTLEAIIDKTVSLVKSGKLRDITDIRDETGLDGLKIAIDIRRTANPEMIMHKLFALTPLTDTYSCNFNVLVNGHPKTMGVREIIKEWVAFRVDCIRRGLLYDLQKDKEKLHLLDGLSIILSDIDKAIRLIRETEDDKQVIPNLCKGFGIDEIQSEYIAEIKLRNLNKEHLINRVNELDNIKKEIREIEEKIANEVKIYAIIERELRDISKKYGMARKTDIVYNLEEIPIRQEMFIEDYPIRLFLTEHNYFKKITATSLRASNEQYLKDGDTIILELEATNKSELLFFSDNQNVYKMKAHDISECKASSIGEYLSNLLGCDENEKIVYITVSEGYDGYMLFAFENGKVAKVDMGGYATKTNRKKLVNAYSDKFKCVYMARIKEDADFVAIRDKDKAVLLNTSLISSVGSKNSLGIQIYTLKKNSKMTRLIPADKFNAKDIEHYRTVKIPSIGHFLTEDDKSKNGLTAQVSYDN